MCLTIEVSVDDRRSRRRGVDETCRVSDLFELNRMGFFRRLHPFFRGGKGLLSSVVEGSLIGFHRFLRDTSVKGKIVSRGKLLFGGVDLEWFRTDG